MLKIKLYALCELLRLFRSIDQQRKMKANQSIPYLGVNIAILQDGNILLTRREDFEIWCLPGGGVDEGETLAEAALRETREETGLEVVLTRLVGIYSRPAWRTDSSHVVVFAATPHGGQLRPQPEEVLQLRFFAPQDIPAELVAGQRRRIQDALEGVCGAVWLQNIEWPFKPQITRQEIYELRDRSGLSRSQFYLQSFRNFGPENETLEVKGVELIPRLTATRNKRGGSASRPIGALEEPFEP